MSIAALIRNMAAAGAPPEAIAIAVEAIEAADAKLAAGRAVARDRKRRQRERDGHGTVTGQSVTERDSPPSPSPSPQTPQPRPHPPGECSIAGATREGPTRTEIARGFLAFWAEYPKRVGKDAAAKAFGSAMRRITTPDPLETILAGLRRALPGWDDPQFIPHPATWLNQGRWDDDAPTIRTEKPAHVRPANDDKLTAKSANLARGWSAADGAAAILADRRALR